MKKREKNLIIKCAVATYVISTFALFAMTCYYANMLADNAPTSETVAAFMG